MGRMKRAGAAAAAIVLTVGLAACGDDDDDASTDDTTTEDVGGEATADPAAFCDALVEFNGLVNQVEIDDTSSEDEVVEAGEQLAPLFDEMADNAPESVAGAAADLNERAIQPLLEGDATGFNADETFASYTALVEDSVGECDFEEVAVTAVDYAFEGVPATVPAGDVAFELTNDGAEEHEMIILRRADGVTQSFEEIVNLSEEESQSMVEFAAAGFAPPGERGSTLASLEPGQYGMVCFIPVGGGDDGPPHFTQGMLTEFTVE